MPVYDVGDVVALTVTFKNAAGTPTEPTTAALAITLPDGTTDAPALSSGSTGVRNATYAPAVPGVFEYVWTGTGSVTAVEGGQFEVRSAAAGYFTISELRARPNLPEATYGDAVLDDARAWIEGVVERVCGTSFIRRRKTAVLDGGGVSAVLPDIHVIALVSVTVDGVALTAGELDACSTRSGLLRRKSGTGWLAWPAGVENIEVVYVAGWSQICPADLRGAMIDAARYRVLSTMGASGTPDRALSITNEFGNISLAAAGRPITAAGKVYGLAPTGLPEADAVILDYADRVAGPGFA